MLRDAKVSDGVNPEDAVLRVFMLMFQILYAFSPQFSINFSTQRHAALREEREISKL